MQGDSLQLNKKYKTGGGVCFIYSTYMSKGWERSLLMIGRGLGGRNRGQSILVPPSTDGRRGTDAGGEKPTAEQRETQEVRQGSSSRGIPPHHPFRKNWIATNTGEEMHATVTRR